MSWDSLMLGAALGALCLSLAVHQAAWARNSAVAAVLATGTLGLACFLGYWAGTAGLLAELARDAARGASMWAPTLPTRPRFALSYLATGSITAGAFGVLLLTRPASVIRPALGGLGLLLGAAALVILADSLLLLFVGFELLLLTSLYLLRVTSKSERVLEAAAEMALWTLLGSLGLLAGFSQLFVVGVTRASQVAPVTDLMLGLFFIVGFGVKVPLWPCFSWLLKAHVEASVEFSILLSGLIVKLGAWGLMRVLHLLGSTEPAFILSGLSLIAMFEATLRLLAQRDLKRIVALTTVIEMNWLTLCLALGGVFENVAALLAVAHSFSTIAEFYLVECIARRFNTRDLTQIAGLSTQTPLLFAASVGVVLTTVGFPGTSIFSLKLLFLTHLLAAAPFLFGPCLILFFFILPVFFMRIWVPLWFGASPVRRAVPDLSWREATLLAVAVAGGVLVGVVPTFFLAALPWTSTG